MALSNIIAFDDAPFKREFRGDILVVGTVYAATRLEGVLSTKIRRDGANSTKKLAETVENCKFGSTVQLMMLQGIALGGFNVIDVVALHQRLQLPVLVVARRQPVLAGIKTALLRLPGGARKWRLIEALGPMEPAGPVFVQRLGLSLAEASETLRRSTSYGNMPDPLRSAHLIAGGITDGQSRGRT
jgi:uncharacterized protein